MFGGIKRADDDDITFAWGNEIKEQGMASSAYTQLHLWAHSKNWLVFATRSGVLKNQ